MDDATVNAAPEAAGSSIALAEDGTFSGQLSASDPDSASSDLSGWPAADSRSTGTVTIAADGSYTYVPDADFSGSDSFSYVVSDGAGGSDQANRHRRGHAGCRYAERGCHRRGPAPKRWPSHSMSRRH